MQIPDSYYKYAFTLLHYKTFLVQETGPLFYRKFLGSPTGYDISGTTKILEIFLDRNGKYFNLSF